MTLLSEVAVTFYIYYILFILQTFSKVMSYMS